MIFDSFERSPEEMAALSAEIKSLQAKSDLKIEVPPPSHFDLEAEFLRFRSRKAIMIAYPVLKRQLNPIGVMQGGFLAAAFDNTFGALAFSAAQKPNVTLDMTQTYLRGVREGDKVFCEAQVVARGSRTIYLTASAYDQRQKLIATAQTQIFIL